MIAETVRAASSTHSNEASAVQRAAGIGIKLSAARVTTPRIPFGSDRHSQQVDLVIVAESEQAAIGERDVDRQHVVKRDTVLDTPRTTGVLRYIAADRRDREWTPDRRIDQTQWRGCGLEVGVDDARLDDRAPCLRVDLHDPIHAREIQHQRIIAGCDRRGEVRRSATRNDRDTVLGCIAEQCHDLSLPVRRAVP